MEVGRGGEAKVPPPFRLQTCRQQAGCLEEAALALIFILSISPPPRLKVLARLLGEGAGQQEKKQSVDLGEAAALIARPTSW